MKHFALISIAAILTACGSPQSGAPIRPVKAEVSAYTLDQAGEDFVKIALRMGEIDGDYVDAYSGPKEWRAEIKNTTVNPNELAEDISALGSRLELIDVGPSDTVRRRNLVKLLRAMAVRLDVLRSAAHALKTILTYRKQKNFVWNL